MSRSLFVVTIVLLALAFTGILAQHGQANTITYLCVAPLALWVIYQVVRAIINAIW